MPHTTSRYALLGLLSHGPMSGYAIRQLIERSIGHFWRESYGQIYPALRQLATDGLVAAHSERDPGRPERRVYTLTERGHAALCTWLADPEATIEPTRHELLLKLFFGRHAPPGADAARIARYRETYKAMLAGLDATERQLASQHAGSPEAPYWRMTIRHGRLIAEALLAWCDETLAALATIERKGA